MNVFDDLADDIACTAFPKTLSTAQTHLSTTFRNDYAFIDNGHCWHFHIGGRLSGAIPILRAHVRRSSPPPRAAKRCQ